jgi:hypothetical protein
MLLSWQKLPRSTWNTFIGIVSSELPLSPPRPIVALGSNVIQILSQKKEKGERRLGNFVLLAGIWFGPVSKVSQTFEHRVREKFVPRATSPSPSQFVPAIFCPRCAIASVLVSWTAREDKLPRYIVPRMISLSDIE